VQGTRTEIKRAGTRTGDRQGENVMKNGYKKHQINEMNLNQNNGSNNIGFNLQLNGNANSMLVEETYVENVLKKINQNYLLEGNKKNMWQEESQRVNSEYKYKNINLEKKLVFYRKNILKS
jgi:hypothetical protein